MNTTTERKAATEYELSKDFTDLFNRYETLSEEADGDIELYADLNIIFLAHTQTERDDNGYSFTKIKTSGKKLDKIVLESKFTTVLLAKHIGNDYVFETQSVNSTAKTPMGLFDAPTIPNDITLVIKALEEYEK